MLVQAAKSSVDVGLPRKRRAPDTSADDKNYENVGAGAGAAAGSSSTSATASIGADFDPSTAAPALAGAGAGSSAAGLAAASNPAAPAAMTPGEVDAAVVAELAKKFPAGMEAWCEDRAERLREATYALPELDSGFDADDALTVALRHQCKDVVRHGAQAFRWLADRAPAAVLRLLKDGDVALLSALRSAVATADADVCRFVLEGLYALTKQSASAAGAAAGAGARAVAAGEASAVAELVTQGAVDVIIAAADHVPRSSVDCAIAISALLQRLVEHSSRTAATEAARLSLMRSLLAAGTARAVCACVSAHGSDQRVAGPAVRVLQLLSEPFYEVFDTDEPRAAGQQLLEDGACEAAVALCRAHVQHQSISMDACDALQLMAATCSAVVKRLIELDAPKALASVMERWPPLVLVNNLADDPGAPVCALSALAIGASADFSPSTDGQDNRGIMSAFTSAISPIAALLRSVSDVDALGGLIDAASTLLLSTASIACDVLDMIACDHSTHAAFVAARADAAVVDMLDIRTAGVSISGQRRISSHIWQKVQVWPTMMQLPLLPSMWPWTCCIR